MTDAATGSAERDEPLGGPRPLLLTIAAVVLAASALLGLVFPISQITDRTFLGCSLAVASANASPTASSSGSASASPSSTATLSQQQQREQFDDCLDGQGSVAPQSADEVDSQTGRLLLQGVIPLLLLAGLAFFAYRGAPLVRWFTVGLWVLGGLVGLVPFGPLQAITVLQSRYPVVTTVIVVLGSVLFTAAALLVNFPVVTRYFSARRPVRAAGAAGGGGLLGGLFGPRPPRGGAGTGGPTRAGSAPVSVTKPPASSTTPAATRPANRSKNASGGAGNTGRPGRSKGKKRG